MHAILKAHIPSEIQDNRRNRNPQNHTLNSQLTCINLDFIVMLGIHLHSCLNLLLMHTSNLCRKKTENFNLLDLPHKLGILEDLPVFSNREAWANCTVWILRISHGKYCTKNFSILKLF